MFFLLFAPLNESANPNFSSSRGVKSSSREIFIANILMSSQVQELISFELDLSLFIRERAIDY